ncbi:F0F1 ATP synthase subunit B [Desulfoferrobacter suflitae]|uniref:F0F1 ATP synthase subunit B n=1 Tax=Desulfoferrobacter suflitae TaxID=2865782 RepID=UPI002164EB99|nr:F0F1 ATP synthase subunit B [Desulfoferrobacter suflitae]MCK8601134.1 F0F1 ATP synthase subunit B [Desulfoferrobacter suflitae]
MLIAGLLLGLQGLALAAEAGGHGHELNWKDFLFRVMNFAIMAAILIKLLKKPMAKYFASRREDIQKMLADLELKKQEAEQKCAEYKAKLAALEEETQKIVSEYVQEGEMERAKILEAAERQAAYIKEQADLSIQQEIKAAKDSLQKEVGELSVTAAEEILRKNMQSDDQERLVRDFMTKVVEAK